MVQHVGFGGFGEGMRQFGLKIDFFRVTRAWSVECKRKG